jgi:HK97 family phage major capsid protein
MNMDIEEFKSAIDEGLIPMQAAFVEHRRKIEERLAAVEKKSREARESADRIEVAMARIPGSARVGGPVTTTLETKAFTMFIRQGREALGPDEVKSLVVSDDSRGGYLAPAEFSREVDKNIVQFSPIRQAARVSTTASGSVIIPRRTGAPNAGWVGETEPRPEAQPAYGQITIPISEAAAYIDISNTLLEDGAVDIGAEVAFDLGEEFGRIEGSAFVNGNGVKRPQGILNDSAVASIPSGNATNLTADSLIDLFYALAPFYRQRGAWLLNGKTLAAIRKMKDGDGQYLWSPGLAADQPATILGRPAIEAVDMPDVAANAFPIVFGDFASGYRIYDRTILSLLRDPYSQATNGLTRFHARRRVGGGVVRAEAMCKMKIAAA